MKSKKFQTCPSDLILILSGVPGAGKTTISYELLKQYNLFKIIEETDLIREVLRGYTNYLIANSSEELSVIKKNNIIDHGIILSYQETINQCKIMAYSIKKIIERQQRKHIPTIINGTHIIPNIINELFVNPQNIVYINLYISDKNVIKERIYNRDYSSKMIEDIDKIFVLNKDININFLALSNSEKVSHHVIDVTNLSVNETISAIVSLLEKKFAI